MAQHDYIISNQTFPNTRADINNLASAIATNNSGTSAPSTQYAGQFWIDTTTTTWTLYIHDGTDDIQFATIDTSANTVNFTDSALDVVTDTTPQLGGDLDLNSNDITGTGNINITGTATVTGLTTTGDINFGDNDKAVFGASSDLEIYHDGSNSYVADEGTGRLILRGSNEVKLQSATGETYIICTANDNVRLYYDGAEKLATTTNGIAVTGGITTTDNINIPDGDSLYLGDSLDLRLWHDGSNSFIIDQGTGNLYIRAGVDLRLQTSTGENGVIVNENSSVELYNDNALRLATTSTGVNLYNQGTTNVDLELITGAINDRSCSIKFSQASGSTVGSKIESDHYNNALRFYHNDGTSERMRIDSSGDLFHGKTTNNSNTAGTRLATDGQVQLVRDSARVVLINRLGDDGGLIDFAQAGVTEGSISVSGATVTYGGFTGSHWSRLSDNSKPTILRGTILESLDEMMDWYQVQFDITETDDEGNETTRTEKQSYALGDGENVGDVITYNHEGTDYSATIIQEDDVKHTKSKISDTVDAKNVYGVFVNWDDDDDTVNDMNVAQTGTFVVRMNSAETVSKGDLIQSNGDGTGKVQADDLLRASTVAKVLSTTKIETYDDGSYIVPCSLHC